MRATRVAALLPIAFLALGCELQEVTIAQPEPFVVVESSDRKSVG